ncbi:hypothetical protein [Pseudomonas sp. MWU13-2100]|uniref:hypothetical protein n=1 Tax=Pseudomonas sp. MWU13-2100 TaxID=2935075 RepID=UPI00200BEAE7|nr:hypothetical protein [Pseudomonas sp. MWU13-2100]
MPVLSQAGFLRGNVEYVEELSKKFLFPADLTNYGINHVGCIDILDGEILAPLEDKRYAGENYLNPMLATFDPETFAYTGTHALLPRDEDQDNGVPWVAADAAHGVVYTSKYSPERLNIFPIATLWSGTPVREQLQLSRRIRDVQAGKVLDGHLYVISEEEVKVIDLTDGAVFDVHLGGYLPRPENPDYFYEWEHEGLAFFHGEKGSFLHLTAVRSLGGPDIIYPIPTGVVVFDFKISSK